MEMRANPEVSRQLVGGRPLTRVFNHPHLSRAATMPDQLPSDSLRVCEAALRQAQLASDTDALEPLLDDALVFTGPDGRVYGKADDLDAHRSGVIRITRLEPSEERIMNFGQLAVVIVRMEMAGAFHGEPFGGAFRYTRVWRDGPGGWRIVAGHVSAVRA